MTPALQLPNQTTRCAGIVGLLACLLMVGGWLPQARAQGLPEPGMVLYGAVTNSATGAALTSGTVTWRFAAGTNMATATGAVSNVNGQFLYVVEMPFETVLAGMTLSSNKLAFPTTSTTYGCSVSLNGTNVTILATSGTNLTVAAADRGKQVRMNLQFTPAGTPETYETWSTRYFGVPNANPNADPDGDGRTNLQEYQNGTNPTDAGSATRTLTVSTSGSGSVTRVPNQTNYANGSTVTLTSTPLPGYFFTAWSGTTNTPANPLTLTMARDFSLVASFSLLSNALATVATQTVSELTLLTVTNRATNITVPTLRFALGAGAPSGAVMNATNGILTWMPSEAQGPSTNVLSVLVFDTNQPTAFATNTFSVVVNEVNTAPVLPVQTNRTVNELSTLTVTNTAPDADLPANTLTYSLLVSPAGMVISPTGIITWTPTEAQGPSTNTVTTKVSDNGVPSLSATNIFLVVVTEANTTPVLTTSTNRTVNPGETVTFLNTATDADTPANTLTFSLFSGPPGATVNPGTGQFTWRPGITNANTTNTVQVRVTDNGSPALSDTRSFTITVRPLTPVSLTSLGFSGANFRVNISGPVGPDYTLQTTGALSPGQSWVSLTTTNPVAMPLQLDVIGARAITTNRFYRVLLGP